ncbi:MAG: hypothetical protein QNJ53_29525 [Pleurocapsa sp. MO_192.B19]|nr:hypothetical protein [Pleurocapsa sp. MO_192.B19]
MQSNMFLPFISDRISQKNRNLAIALRNWRLLRSARSAIAKQLKYRNLLKLHFDVRKVG